MRPKYENANEFVRAALQYVIEDGEQSTSGAKSMNAGQEIREVYNSHFILAKPNSRVFTTKAMRQPFRIGLAVARFLYMLSGSNRVEPIKFYSPAVVNFSDDGDVIPGSAYGFKVFGPDFSGSQFVKVAELIASRVNTKRAQISIYTPDDAGRDSRDIPCASAVVFMPRDNKLNMTLQMRANDALKLLPYNLFEFSLLQECMANFTGMELGEFHHTAVSLHLRGAGITEASNVVCELDCPQVSIPRMQRFSASLRQQVLELELQMRLMAIKNKAPELNWFEQNVISKGFDLVWIDLLAVILLEVSRIAGANADTLLSNQERLIQLCPELVLSRLY